MKHPVRMIVAVCALVLCMGAPFQAWGQVPLPYVDGFDAYGINEHVTNQNGTAFDGSGDGSARVKSDQKLTGLYSCYLTNYDLTLNIDDGQNYTNAWCMLYVNLLARFEDGGTSQEPEIEPDTVCSFYVNTNSELKAYNGTGWVVQTNGIAQGVGNWYGFAAHLDYAARKWDLYYSTGGSHLENLVKVNDLALQMNALATNNTCLSKLVVSSGDDLYIDEMAASEGFFSVSDNSGVTLDVELYEPAETNTAFVIPIASRYTNTATGDTLAGTVGHEIAAGLTENDRILVYNTNGWNEYNLNASGDWVEYQGPGPDMDPADVRVRVVSGLRLERVGATEGISFYAYNELAVANGTPVNQTPLGGTDAGDESGGYTGLVNPHLTPRDVQNGLGFDQSLLEHGDSLWIRLTSGRWVSYYWDEDPAGSPGRWMKGNQSTGIGQWPGRGFAWLGRPGGGNPGYPASSF